MSSGKTILRGQTNELGNLIFSELKTQSYYLNASLKEYSFGDGSTQTVDIIDAEHAVIVIEGKRNAFSAYGQVFKLDG